MAMALAFGCSCLFLDTLSRSVTLFSVLSSLKDEELHCFISNRQHLHNRIAIMYRRSWQCQAIARQAKLVFKNISALLSSGPLTLIQSLASWKPSP